MSSNWIKIDHTMPDKPEVGQLADILGIDQDAVVGKLIRFWIWLDSQSVDGSTPNVPDTFLDRLTSCPGFTAAAITVGWLIRRQGRVSVPHFDRHNGQSAKVRALSSARVKRHRNVAGVTDPLPDKIQERELDCEFDHENIVGFEDSVGKYILAQKRGLKLRNDAERSFLAKVCILESSGRISENVLASSLEALRAKSGVKKPVAFLRTVMAEKCTKAGCGDLGQLIASVKVPRQFYEEANAGATV